MSDSRYLHTVRPQIQALLKFEVFEAFEASENGRTTARSTKYQVWVPGPGELFSLKLSTSDSPKAAWNGTPSCWLSVTFRKSQDVFLFIFVGTSGNAHDPK